MSLTARRRLCVAIRRCAAALGVALSLACTPAQAAEWLIAFQAVPDRADAVYNQQAVQTAGLASELGPSILAAVGLDPGAFDAEVVIGGYRGRISPSVVLHVDGDLATADRLAAAVGFVFMQDSVLVWQDMDTGGTFAAFVAFPSLSPTLADFFFRNAIAVNLGLGGGFTARDNRLLFLNLRDGSGKPLSNLEDDGFAAGLRQAAKAFGDIAVVTTARADAHLLARDAYAATLGQDPMPGLGRLKNRRGELLAAPR